MENLTQLDAAKKQTITKEMSFISKKENIPETELIKNIRNGNTVILKSKLHDCRPVAVGKNLKIKINANIGTSNMNSDIEVELKKLDAAIKYGADTVMDLSTGGNIHEIRKIILKRSNVPIGTVPVYEAIVRQPDVSKISSDDLIESVRIHIEDGVDFVTIHSGLTKKCIPLLNSRILGVFSRGGSFLVKWMMHHKKENPLYERFDEILEMAKKYDVCLSLGDGLRPGCLADATDKAQIEELKTLGELAKRAHDKGVQVMIEGPGHVPMNQIKENMELEKKYCHDAPFYVLGPLVTDISPGYDHLTGAIGGAIAAMNGADFLCYLTPKEHLGLPDLNDVIDGVIASKIAAHAADIARGIKNARDIDDDMAKARSNLDWEKMYALALNPEKARELRKSTHADSKDVCTMCGDFCSAKINKECRKHYEDF